MPSWGTTPVACARGLRVGEKLSGAEPRLQGVNENDTFSENEGMIRTIPVNYLPMLSKNGLATTTLKEGRDFLSYL